MNMIVTLKDGYTGTIHLDGDVTMHVINGFVTGANVQETEIQSTQTSTESFIDTYAKGITDKVYLDSKTIATLDHGRIMKVEIES